MQTQVLFQLTSLCPMAMQTQMDCFLVYQSIFRANAAAGFKQALYMHYSTRESTKSVRI